MAAGLLTRRRALQMAAIAAGGLAAPAVRRAAAETATAQRGIVLAWHTNIAARWLDPQQHDGTATPDNFLNALHDGLIKNSGTRKFDHLALAERYEFAEDAKSCTFVLRSGLKFHDGSPVSPQDVKWSFEHYRGAWKGVLAKRTQDIEINGGNTVRFHFNEPFLDFPILMGTSNVCGAGWVVPAKYQNIMRKWGRTGSCRSRSARVPTGSSRNSRAFGSISRRSTATTARSTQSS
jgi:ABC-type transport system substrate-binding protein